MKCQECMDGYVLYGGQYEKYPQTPCREHRRNEYTCGCAQGKRRDCEVCIQNTPHIHVNVNGSGSGTENVRRFVSGYFEALGSGQTVAVGGDVVFDAETVDIEGNVAVLSQNGKVITINRTGLYQVEWNVNLARDTAVAVLGIVENGEGASGSGTTTGGNFASGTLIRVAEVPFTISLRNYNGAAVLEDVAPFENSAASIRIVRFADLPE